MTQALVQNQHIVGQPWSQQPLTAIRQERRERALLKSVQAQPLTPPGLYLGKYKEPQQSRVLGLNPKCGRTKRYSNVGIRRALVSALFNLNLEGKAT